MPNKKGGKKFKRGKKISEHDKKLILRSEKDGQQYAKILKVNGSGRYQIFCFDGKERLGISAGNIRKKARLTLSDIVLVSLWDFQENKCSIVHKYEEDEVYKLKTMGEFPDNIQLEEENPFDDNSVDFTYEGPEMPRDIPDSDSSEESEEEIDLEDI